jgi:hypothetical protein
MLGVKITIRRYAHHSQPGWVECKLTDAHGQEWRFIEKAPVVTRADLDASTSYPQSGVIACQIIDRRLAPDGREVVTVDTSLPWDIASASGQTHFDVSPNQLLDFCVALFIGRN